MQSHLFKSNPISWTLIGSGGSCYTLGLPSCHGDVRVRVCVWWILPVPGVGGWLLGWGETQALKTFCPTCACSHVCCKTKDAAGSRMIAAEGGREGEGGGQTGSQSHNQNTTQCKMSPAIIGIQAYWWGGRCICSSDKLIVCHIEIKTIMFPHLQFCQWNSREDADVSMSPEWTAIRSHFYPQKNLIGPANVSNKGLLVCLVCELLFKTFDWKCQWCLWKVTTGATQTRSGDLKYCGSKCHFWVLLCK